uniref:Transposase n=1 Tax=Panagrellus redivivus TaxID=6233 RepID=A0A7E4ZRQ0_PANRE
MATSISFNLTLTGLIKRLRQDCLWRYGFEDTFAPLGFPETDRKHRNTPLAVARLHQQCVDHRLQPKTSTASFTKTTPKKRHRGRCIPTGSLSPQGRGGRTVLAVRLSAAVVPLRKQCLRAAEKR